MEEHVRPCSNMRARRGFMIHEDVHGLANPIFIRPAAEICALHQYWLSFWIPWNCVRMDRSEPCAPGEHRNQTGCSASKIDKRSRPFPQREPLRLTWMFSIRRRLSDQDTFSADSPCAFLNASNMWSQALTVVYDLFRAVLPQVSLGWFF